MKKDATDKGVSKETTDPRDELVNSILAKNRAEDEEYDEYMADADQEENPDEIEDKEPVEEPAGEEPADEKPEEPQEQMVEVVVDGEKKKVPLSEIVDAGKRTLQKESAADKRLEEATKLLKEAKEVSTQEEQPPVEDAEKPLEVSKDIVQAIQYGTEEEAQKAVQELIKMGQTKESLTPDNIKSIVAETVRAETNQQAVLRKFSKAKEEGGFADIKEDPYLMNMAIGEVNALLESGEENTWETYEKAGKKVRDWVSKFQTTQDTSFETKKEKKRQTDTVKGATAAKVEKKKEKPKSASEIIKEIGSSRPGGGG